MDENELARLEMLNKELDAKRAALLQSADLMGEEKQINISDKDIERQINDLLTKSALTGPVRTDSNILRSANSDNNNNNNNNNNNGTNVPNNGFRRGQSGSVILKRTTTPRSRVMTKSIGSLESKDTSETRDRIEKLSLRLARLTETTQEEKDAIQELARARGPEHELVVLREANAALTAKQTALESALESVRKQLEQSKASEEASVAEASSLRKTTKAQLIKIEKLEINFSKLKNENDALKSRLQSAESENSRLDKLLRNKNQVAESKEKMLVRVGDESARWKQEVDKLRSELKEAANTRINENEKKNEDYNRLKEQMGKMEVLVKKQKQLIDNLKRQKLHLEMLVRIKLGDSEFHKILELGIE